MKYTITAYLAAISRTSVASRKMSGRFERVSPLARTTDTAGHSNSVKASSAAPISQLAQAPCSIDASNYTEARNTPVVGNL